MGNPSGLWTSVSGAMAQSQNIDTTANNIANANTVGFKKDEPTFKEYLTAVERPNTPIVDIPRTAFKDSDFYHHDGRENAMVNVDAVHTDHSQGSFRMTNNPLDVAIDGPGYFAVRTPNGIMFSRAGDFKMNAQGQLVTTDGYPVLGIGGGAPAPAPGAVPAVDANGQPVAAATAAPNPFAEVLNRAPAQEQPGTTPPPNSGLQPINIADATKKVTISPEGQVFSGEDLLGTLAMAEFPNLRSIKKLGSNLYENADPANVPNLARNTRVRQGFLEQSNVNTISELTNLIKANRLFEGNMRAIRAYNDMAGREANEVGKL